MKKAERMTGDMSSYIAQRTCIIGFRHGEEDPWSEEKGPEK